MIKSLIKIFSRNFCIFIANFFSPKFKIVEYVFNISKKTASDSIYFIKYKDKEKIISFLNKNVKKNFSDLYYNLKNINVDNNMKLVLEDLNSKGISDDFNSIISEKESSDFNLDMQNINYYDSHVPYLSKVKPPNVKPDGAYKSYSYEAQINNPTLLKICLDEKILKIATEYLGTIPKIYSINTFVTVPGKKAFTHDFHRDIDNIKWLVVFIYWTQTYPDDGAFEQICYTHKPSNKLSELLEKKPNLFSKNFDNFFKKTVPGYGLNDHYNELFNSQIINISGKPGKIVMCDTMGLHRGTNVKNLRNVTWIRYGVTSSRQSVLKSGEILNKKVELTTKCRQIINNSKYKYVLSNFV